MKQTLSILMLLSLTLLGACGAQENQIQSEVEAPTQDVVPDTLDSEQIKKDDTDQDTQVQQIDETPLYLTGGPGRENYDDESYLTLGESFVVGNSGRMYGKVSLDSYELIEDSNGSGRQALLLWFTETNTDVQAIEVGLYGAESMLSAHVFYGDLGLQRLSHYQPDTKFFDPDYIENMHVQYGNEDETKPQSCAYSVTLEPGESRSCFSHYSYAGNGEYLISQLIDSANNTTPENSKSYLIEVN